MANTVICGAKLRGTRVLNLPSNAIAIASRSLPVDLTATFAPLLGPRQENGSPLSLLLSFLVSTIHVVWSIRKYTRHNLGILVWLRKAVSKLDFLLSTVMV